MTMPNENTLFRIAVIGTRAGGRRYVAGPAGNIELVGLADALHWEKGSAQILCDAFNQACESRKRPERFQIEASDYMYLRLNHGAAPAQDRAGNEWREPVVQPVDGFAPLFGKADT